MSTTVITPAMPYSMYAALRAVNYSTLKQMEKSPAHYLHSVMNRSSEDSDALQRGRIVHCAVFEPDLLTTKFIAYPRTRSGKEWEAFRAAHSHMDICTARMWDAAMETSLAVRGDATARKYVSAGRSELTIQWQHVVEPMAGFPGWSEAMKGRLDFVADAGYLVDLKTTKDASPSGFGRSVVTYEYLMQAAMYVDGWAAATGKVLPYVFVAVESAAPNVVQCYQVPEHLIELGRDKYRAALAKVRVCRETNSWPGYASAELELELPPWALPAEDDALDGLTFEES